MKNLILAIALLCSTLSYAEKIEGNLLLQNHLDSTAKHLLFNIVAGSCKNCVYLNDDLIKSADAAGYKISFIITQLAKEDIGYYKEDNSYIAQYNIIVDPLLSGALGAGTVSLINKTDIQINTSCDEAYTIKSFLAAQQQQENKNIKDSVLVDTTYNFNSGSAAFLDEEYCLLMDLRYYRKVHKINMQTGAIAQEFTFDEKQWAQKIYSNLYAGNAWLANKSLKARDVFLKRGRIFDVQEFRPDNIAVRNGRTLLALNFSFPYFEMGEADTLMKNTIVLFELTNQLEIKNYWVAPIGALTGDFFISNLSNMPPLFFNSDTVFLPVFYNYTPQTPQKKYNYAKFVLAENNQLQFNTFLPFLMPDDKAGITGDYNVIDMFLFEYENNIAGSYITYPAIYNLNLNKKITDIERAGLSSHKNGKIDSLLFAKEINSLGFLITYFDKYNDNHYIMQAKNGDWNTYVLFDKQFNVLKTIYQSKNKKEPKIFHVQDGIAYSVKFDGAANDKFYIYKQQLTNLFDKQIN